MLSLSEIFLVNLGTDYTKENVVKALEETEKELRNRIGGFEDENKVIDFFFSPDDEGKDMPNVNFDELLCLWDVFAEFDQLTKAERYNHWNGEAFILKLLYEMINLNEINNTKRGYLRCREKERFDQFLDFIYEKKGKKSIVVVNINKENGKLKLKERYPIYKKFLYTSRKELRDEQNRRTLTAINVLFHLFKTYGAMLLSVQNGKEIEYYGFCFYNRRYFKLPKAITKSLSGSLK